MAMDNCIKLSTNTTAAVTAITSIPKDIQVKLSEKYLGGR